jgi:hypothetical protein
MLRCGTSTELLAFSGPQFPEMEVDCWLFITL